MFNKKINSDLFLLVLLVVRLRLDYDIGLNDRHIRVPESREVFLGSTSAYTQITFHSPYPSIQYPHPKSLELNEQDEAAILFNRLNYFNSVRERRSNLIAYYASSSEVQNAGASVESSNAEVATATGGDVSSENPSLPTTAEGNHETPGGTSREIESAISIVNELTPEDMDLIEILWKQDIDLGVSREAYDSRSGVEVEKIKDVEYSKDNLQDFYIPGDGKNPQENVTEPIPVPGLNYTVDSETGEFVLDEFPGLIEDEISSTQLLENDTFPPVNCDSYLPFNAEDTHLSNISDVFPSDLFMNEYTDSEFLLSHIGDFEKELGSISDNDLDDDLFTQPEDVFPTLDDCWPDSTAMLPLLTLGNSHQNPFVSITTQPETVYQNNNPTLPLSSNVPSQSTDDFTGILNSASLEASTSHETFRSIPATSGPSSVGCALAESIATLHNDTDPIPNSSLITTVYNPDLPELIYSNQSLSTPHNELLITDLFTDEDFKLPASSEANQKLNFNEDNPDESNDSASLTSGRVPSVSDCRDWIDSCSESSSHHGENQTHSFVPLTSRGNSFGQSTEFYQPSMLPKRQRQHENNNDRNTDFRRAHFDPANGNDRPYFSSRSEYSNVFESNGAVSGNQLPTYRKFDYSTSAGGACSSILQHNHSYHLPFSNSDSQDKPVTRDKSKSPLSDEDSFNKDEKRAKELNLPISIEDIINLAIDEYNERLSKYELTDQQLNLIRDIRRRGKNKVAAQNCRKRKMDEISSLQKQIGAMRNEKVQLKSKQHHLLQEKNCLEDKYAQLNHIISQHTNCKPPSPPNSSNSLPDGHNSDNDQMTVPTLSDVLMSSDDSDHCRGARTKRKSKK